MDAVRALLNRQFSSLRIYNYRVYFFGQMVSLIGTWMQTTGQAWLVLKITGSPLALGTVTTLQFLPMTIFILFGGVVADRVPKRKLLVVTQSLALVQASIMGALVITGTVELWHIYCLALMLGLINAFGNPVRQAFVVELVGKDQLVNAVALNSSVFNAARILGPAAAGLTIGFTGLSVAFFLNAISFVAVLAAYAAMRPSQFMPVQRGARSGRNVLSQVGEGFSYARRTPSVMYLFIVLAFIGTFGYNFTVVIPLVAKFVLNAGPERFGLLTSFMGVGSLVGALSVAATGRASDRVFLLAMLGFVATFAAVAASRWFPVTCVLLVVLGMTTITFTTTINTSLQLHVPDELRGRVLSIYQLLLAGTTPIGGWFTGQLAEQIGVPRTLGIEAALCALGVIVGLAYRALHTGAFREEAARHAAEQSALRG